MPSPFAALPGVLRGSQLGIATGGRKNQLKARIKQKLSVSSRSSGSLAGRVAPGATPDGAQVGHGEVLEALAAAATTSTKTVAAVTPAIARSASAEESTAPAAAVADSSRRQGDTAEPTVRPTPGDSGDASLSSGEQEAAAVPPPTEGYTVAAAAAAAAGVHGAGGETATPPETSPTGPVSGPEGEEPAAALASTATPAGAAAEAAGLASPVQMKGEEKQAVEDGQEKEGGVESRGPEVEENGSDSAEGRAAKDGAAGVEELRDDASRDAPVSPMVDSSAQEAAEGGSSELELSALESDDGGGYVEAEVAPKKGKGGDNDSEEGGGVQVREVEIALIEQGHGGGKEGVEAGEAGDRQPAAGLPGDGAAATAAESGVQQQPGAKEEDGSVSERGCKNQPREGRRASVEEEEQGGGGQRQEEEDGRGEDGEEAGALSEEEDAVSAAVSDAAAAAIHPGAEEEIVPAVLFPARGTAGTQGGGSVAREGGGGSVGDGGAMPGAEADSSAGGIMEDGGAAAVPSAEELKAKFQEVSVRGEKIKIRQLRARGSVVGLTFPTRQFARSMPPDFWAQPGERCFEPKEPLGQKFWLG